MYGEAATPSTNVTDYVEAGAEFYARYTQKVEARQRVYELEAELENLKSKRKALGQIGAFVLDDQIRLVEARLKAARENLVVAEQREASLTQTTSLFPVVLGVAAVAGVALVGLLAVQTVTTARRRAA